jgi:hypothetical protein
MEKMKRMFVAKKDRYRSFFVCKNLIDVRGYFPCGCPAHRGIFKGVMGLEK